MVVFNVQSYSEVFITKFCWESGFLRGSHGEVPPGQWRNRQGQSAPQTSEREIFADVSGKNKERKKGKGVKIEKKRSKMVKGRLKIGNLSRKSC